MIPALPIWLRILVNLAIKIGVPALERHLSPEVVAILEGILAFIKNQPNQTVATAAVSNHLDSLFGPQGIKSDT